MSPRSSWLDKRVIITALASCALTTLVLLGRTEFSFSFSPSTASTSREFLRRRLSDVPLTNNFKFDGTTADLAQHLYRRHQSGASADPVQLVHEDLPDRIRNRLDEVEFRFEALPPLLQRAVIWDSGFGFDPGLEVKLVPIHTVDGMPMSDIAVPQDEFRRTGCTTSNCSDPNGMAAYRSKNCTGDQMLPVVRCASGEVTITKPHTSMWSTGGDDTAIPVMTIQRHAWKDPVNSTDYVVLAIHMIAQENEPAWDNCPSAGQYSSLIIPCDVYEETRALQKNWTEPRFGNVVTPWLQELKAAEKRHKVLVFAVVPICIVLFVAAVAMMVFCCLRKRQESTILCPGIRRCCGRLCGYSSTRGPHHKQPFSSLQRTLLTPPPPPHCLPPPSVDSHTSKPLRPRRSSSSATTSDESMATTDRMVHVLLNDLHLYDKRLPLDKIHFRTLLSKGGFGEVWLCELDGHRVAVKRLLQNHRAIVEDVEAFTDEIQIMAALHHPNIPRFLGVAWTTLNKLCMVTEYLGGGDLQSFLKRRGHQLSWPHEKKTIALGIARALQYLHSRAPVLIHRDIKSRNILVREAPLIAKVTDFGVTRSVQRDNCMTLGVGTPYWTAPEVLDGTSYTEKSDIYSFGVVLSEIDTGESPYHHVQHLHATGEGLQPFHILKMVMAGTIQPRFSASCPVALRELAAKCLTFNPAMRPTARDVVRELETMTWEV